MYRCYHCGNELTWDDAIRSASGKKIPLEAEGSPHRCPNRPAYDSVHKIEEGGGHPSVSLLTELQKVRMR